MPTSPRGITWSGQPVAASTAAQQECGDLLFVGVRGSGEPAPYGDTIASIRDELARRSADSPTAARLSAREIFLDYPAVSPETLGEVGAERLLFEPTMPATAFFDSVRTGRQQLIAVLTDSAQRCPGERWVLSGFSQGAQVVTEALSDDRIPAKSDRLLGAILLGNPADNGTSEGVRRVGDAPAEAMGLSSSLYYIRSSVGQYRNSDDQIGLGGAVRGIVELSRGPIDREITDRVNAEQGFAIPAPLRDRVTRVCNVGDLICNAGPGLGRIVFAQSQLQAEVDQAQPIHLGYSELLDQTVTPTSEAIDEWAWAAPISQDDQTSNLAAIAVPVVAGMLLIGAVAAFSRTRKEQRSQGSRHTGSGQTGSGHTDPGLRDDPESRGGTAATRRDS